MSEVATIRLATEPEPVRFVAHLVLHMLLLAALMAAIASTGGWLRAVLMLPTGFVLMYLFAPFHECTHRNAFGGSRTNRVVAGALGLLIVRPARAYEAFHLAHHRHTNDPGRDPELAGGVIESRRALLVAMSGVPVLIGVLGSTLAAAGGRFGPFVPERLRLVIRREAVLTMVLWAAILAGALAFGEPLVFWMWIGPVIVGLPMLQVALLAEHTTCRSTGNVAVDTRTTMSNRFFRWISWNASMHAAHHVHPKVPYFELPSLTGAIAPELVEVEPSYVASYKTIWTRLGQAHA